MAKTAKTAAQLEREIAEAVALEISDRRIAALKANGEDVRNTSAWRDAMHERRFLTFNSSTASKRKARSGHTRVRITWYAIPNGNKVSGGYLPVYEEDGKQHGDTYGRGYSKAEAEKQAEERAHKAAEHFVGDWDVTVKKGRAKK